MNREDILYIAGDFGEEPEKYRHLIRCKHIFIILGNHDTKGKCKRVFGKDFVYEQKVVKYDNQKIFLCHYPMAFWWHSEKGMWHGYGHLHAAREDCLDKAFPGRHSIDLSPENHFRLYNNWDIFSWETICEYMAGRQGHDDPEFYKVIDKYWKYK